MDYEFTSTSFHNTDKRYFKGYPPFINTTRRATKRTRLSSQASGRLFNFLLLLFFIIYLFIYFFARAKRGIASYEHPWKKKDTVAQVIGWQFRATKGKWIFVWCFAERGWAITRPKARIAVFRWWRSGTFRNVRVIVANQPEHGPPASMGDLPDDIIAMTAAMCHWNRRADALTNLSFI